MSYVIVVQDLKQEPYTTIGLFESVEEAQDYLNLNVGAFYELGMSIVEENEGQGDISAVRAFIAFMNPWQLQESEELNHDIES